VDPPVSVKIFRTRTGSRSFATCAMVVSMSSQLADNVHVTTVPQPWSAPATKNALRRLVTLPRGAPLITSARSVPAIASLKGTIETSVRTNWAIRLPARAPRLAATGSSDLTDWISVLADTLKLHSESQFRFASQSDTRILRHFGLVEEARNPRKRLLQLALPVGTNVPPKRIQSEMGIPKYSHASLATGSNSARKKSGDCWSSLMSMGSRHNYTLGVGLRRAGSVNAPWYRWFIFFWGSDSLLFSCFALRCSTWDA
jgi:hypothetical protein